MKSSLSIVLCLIWHALASPIDVGVGNSYSTFSPQKLVLGNVPSINQSRTFTPFTLSSDQTTATLDYGFEVAGYPFFQVVALNGDVQIEVKYTEAFDALHQPFSDGPFPFTIGLTNTYRVETFNITGLGQITAFLAQGGQRFQSIRLLTSGSVTFSAVGFKATIAPVRIDNLPGQFVSSNQQYNNIWELGARAVSAACFPAGAYNAIWQISSDGALVRGTRPGQSVTAASFANYTLEFDTKITRGGLGWAIAWPFGRGAGIQLNLVGDYPVSTTYVNTNRTLLPANTVVLGYGYSLVNQTTLTSNLLDTFEMPFEVYENMWYHVSVSLSPGNYVAVSVNDIKVFNATLDAYYTGTTGSIMSGTFGFGGWQDQEAYVKNVTIASSNGTIMYTNTMTDATKVLSEFGVQSNEYSVCLDGAKRDRLVWTGDFAHTSRIISASTSRSDYITGTLQTFVDWQIPTGQFPLSPNMGYSPAAATTFATAGSSGLFFPLGDYHILALLSFSSYFKYTSDVAFITKNWSSLKLAVSWLTSQINSTTGLVDLSNEILAFLGPTDGTAVNGAAVEALNGLVVMAKAVGDTTSAATWASIAANLTTTINAKLWNSALGVYSDSLTDAGNYSVAGISFAITSGVAPANRASSCISALQQLMVNPGYKDSTSDSSSGIVTISPNTNGFLLSALMQSNHTIETRYLLDNLWAAMITNDTTDSGASWEYVNSDLQPGLGDFTSLSHPWGGAPTYVLTEYIAGIRPVTPGYKTWIIEPAFAGFDLTYVEAKVQTPLGPLSVLWDISSSSSKKLNVVISYPWGTSGTFVLNQVFANSSLPNTVVSISGGNIKVLSFDL